MFGQAPGGMWPPIASASGAGTGAAPPTASNGMPFNSLYPGLAPGPQGTGHPLATPFVQPYPQNLMQQTQQHHRALAAHHAARTSGVQRASAGQQAIVSAVPAGGAPGGQMMPPAPTSMRTIELQEKRKLEQEKRRKAEEERAKAAKAKEEIFSAGLFDEPQKINSQDDQVAQVLGRFDHNMMSCIGVDYQPPTPAPSTAHHIIGDEDDLPKNPATAFYKRPSHHHPQHMPRQPPRLHPSMTSSDPNPVAMPFAVPPRQASSQKVPSLVASTGLPMGPPPSGIRRESSKNLSKLNLSNVLTPENHKKTVEQQDINKIFSEMINPLGEDAMMPPPLSAIITPKVSQHEGNTARLIPKYFPVVSPPPSPIKPMKDSPEHQVATMMIPNSATVSASNGLKKRWQSEDSESDQGHTFNPGVQLIEKKPPPQPQMINSDKTKPQASTSSASSESSNSESSEDSSDDEKTTSQNNKKNSNENDNLDTFSLGNFLNKVKNQSPAQNNHQSSLNSLNSPGVHHGDGSSAVISPLHPEDDISDLLSQKRSPFPDNLITGGATNPILELRPLSPLKGSPPPVPRNKSQRRRRSHKTKKTAASAAIAAVESSDEELSNSTKIKIPNALITSPRNRPSGGPIPRKNALAQVSATSQEEEETDEGKLGEDLFVHGKGQKSSSRTRDSKKASATSSSHGGRKATVAVAQKTVPQASWPSSSSDEDQDDEDKDVSYGSHRKANASPVKRKKTPTGRTPGRTPSRTPSRTTPSRTPQRQTPQRQTPQRQTPQRTPEASQVLPVVKVEQESAKKSAAISRIFQMKSKAAVKVEVKSEVGSPQPETSILKRLDGRPMLICKIPYSSIRSIKKRERKSSASLAAGSDSSQSGSKKAKRSKVTSVEVDVKPDATDLVDLPGYNKSARNLMPPPENKVEAEAAENYATPNQVYEDPSANQVKDEFQVYMNHAKKLKHEADRDSTNRERQALKYLEAVLYFILCGCTTENRNDPAAAYTMYKETLNLVRHVTRPLRSAEMTGTANNKLAILSLRCQSLLYLKLYKLRRNELRECQQKLEDLLNNPIKNGTSPPGGGGASGGGGSSPTPSPAGSEESSYSKSSGYTSSGEYTNNIIPPAPGYNLSVPHTLMSKQWHYSNYLTQCHELWEMAEVFTTRGHCQDFIAHLDESCGTLTLHSSLKDLVNYTRAGLDFLAKERESIHRARRL